MKNKNKKNIDMIVEEIKVFFGFKQDEDICMNVLENYTKLANSILTKLKENEIVLVEGRVIDLIRDKKLKDLLTYQYLYKTIQLIAKVVKDE